jgi:hypothetical protein
VRDRMLENIPIGADIPKEILNNVNNDICQEIKKELFDSKYEDFTEEEIGLISSNDEIEKEILIKMYRKNDKVLKEFGW